MSNLRSAIVNPTMAFLIDVAPVTNE